MKYSTPLFKKETFFQFHWFLKVIIILVAINIDPVGILADGFYNPDRPMIVPFVVGVFDINERVNDTNGHSLLKEDDGYVYIPPTYYTHNGYSKGIIIVKTFAKNYVAFERRCVHCWYDDGEIGVISMSSLISGKCNQCGARADGMIAYGSGQMNGYDFFEYGDYGPKYLETYPVKIIRKDHNKKIYLWIYNAPNGTYGEWKQQPENQIVVEGCRKLFGSDNGW